MSYRNVSPHLSKAVMVLACALEVDKGKDGLAPPSQGRSRPHGQEDVWMAAWRQLETPP